MDGINDVTLAGNICSDPDMRQTPRGGVLVFRVATNKSYLDKESQTWKTRTEYHNVAVWGKRGEALAKFLRKGAPVTVKGELNTTSSEKDGAKRYFTKVVAQTVIVPRVEGHGDGGQGQDQGPPPQRQQQRRQAPRDELPADSPPADDGGGGFDDEIPF